MIYSILLYLVLILPVSVYHYKKDGGKWLFIKSLNSLITLYVFVLLAGNVKRLLFGLTDGTYLIMKDVSLSLNIAISVIYGLVSFFTVVQIIRLALRKEIARVLFIRIIPLLWVLTGIDKYYAYITIYNEKPSLLYVILSNTLYALIWLVIFLFYNSKKIKAFFTASSLE
ncbi:MAG: hypothetical protein HQ541_07895 [Mariniphaga sp.]|nr:hypothetical protein [Mariniphaga sp.]